MTSPDSDRRSQMSPAMQTHIMETIDVHPLANEALLNQLVVDLSDPEPLDPWEVTKQFVRSLDSSYELLWGDLGLLRPCLGIEHASAVLTGVEEDYLPFFAPDSPPELRLILRLTALLQDSGKVLAVAETGENFTQTEYNRRVTANIMRSIAPELLPEYAKRAVEFLVGQDIIGGLLQGESGAAAELEALRGQWPPELAGDLDDLLLASYLSDASAHSSYRSTFNTRTGWFESAVQPEDSQLTFLFERHPTGVLTLTPDRCMTVGAALPHLRRLRHLAVPGTLPEAFPVPTPAVAFGEVVLRKIMGGGRHTRLDQSLKERTLSLYPTTRLAIAPEANMAVFSQREEATVRPHVVSSLSVNTSENYGNTQHTFHLRRGKVWHRRIDYAYLPGLPVALSVPEITDIYVPPPTEADTRGNATIETALRRVADRERIEFYDFGSPMTNDAAWRVVRWIEAAQLQRSRA